MPLTSSARDVSQLEIAMDAWTKPFWEAGERGRLVAPRCGACSKFRWPPGPFCPHCRSQSVDWVSPGPGKIFSFTVVGDFAARESEVYIPALISFAQAEGVRILGAIVDAPLDAVRIDAEVQPDWIKTANTKALIFRLDPT